MTLTWDFPLPRPHAGVPLGNGIQGLLVWGDTDAHPQRLSLTIGRAGFWDHRGGNPFASRTTFAEIKRLLQADDASGLRRVFGLDGHGHSQRPHQLGCGRLELTLPGTWQPVQATIATAEVAIHVCIRDGHGAEQLLVIRQDPLRELMWISLPPDLALQVQGRPSWEWLAQDLGAQGVIPPRCESTATAGGWCQELPHDAALALHWRHVDHTVAIATSLGDDAWAKAQDGSREGITSIAPITPAPTHLPKVQLPDARLQHAWDLGVHRWLAATAPNGVACTLQGPWLEDYQIPPWSCDYHFNINVQMIYQPGLALGRPAHLTPLWDLLREWMPGLQQAGEAFFGVPEAILLPHAVDDRCQVVGAFWTGMIDHACTGWMAQLAFADWRYHGDRHVLETVAWPLLRGAHAGFLAMAEERDGRLSLPVSVSPEFKGARPDAWGRDASFQLACWHGVLRDLPLAARALGQSLDPQWAVTAARLPAYSTIRAPRTREYPETEVERIALWQGMDLLESHRHHSHLGAIWPFCTIDPSAAPHAAIVKESLYHWVRTGPGAWSGWCVPWAAILCARMGWSDAAVSWLHWQQDVFTNVGHGTLHDGDFPGCTTLVGDTHMAKHEIYQLDAGCGALLAITELLLQERAGVLHVLPTLPRGWRALTFSRLRAPGGFEIGAEVSHGRVSRIFVSSTRGGTLQLAHTLGDHWLCNGQPQTGLVLTTETHAGQQLELTRT
jgi:alpha-L-fucosidase 2